MTASVCSEHQHGTIGTSILHYGMKRRNIRPLAMAEVEKKQNGASKDENCKQLLCPPPHTRNNPCEVVPTSPLSPLRDVVNTVEASGPTPGSVESWPSVHGAVRLAQGQDKTALAQPLHSQTPGSQSKGGEATNEQLFSLTEVTFLQVSMLSSQLPKPGAAPVSPLLSS